jgi:hypothetical protein
MSQKASTFFCRIFFIWMQDDSKIDEVHMLDLSEAGTQKECICDTCGSEPNGRVDRRLLVHVNAYLQPLVEFLDQEIYDEYFDELIEAYIHEIKHLDFRLHYDNVAAWVLNASRWCTSMGVDVPSALKWRTEVTCVPDSLISSSPERRNMRLAASKQALFSLFSKCLTPMRRFAWKIPRESRLCRTPFFIVSCFGRWKFYRIGFVLQKCRDKHLFCPVDGTEFLYQTWSYRVHCTWIRCPATFEHWILARELVRSGCDNFSHAQLAGEFFCKVGPFNFPALPTDVWNIVVSLLLSLEEIVSANWRDARASRTRGFLEFLPVNPAA